MTSTDILGLIGASVTLAVLFELLRRRRLREKYALIWFLVALGAVLVAVFPEILYAVSDLLGVQVASNLLFFLASMLLLLVSIQFSYEIGRLEDRTRTLAEEVALLRLQLEELDPGDRASGPTSSPDRTVPAPDDEGPTHG